MSFNQPSPGDTSPASPTSIRSSFPFPSTPNRPSSSQRLSYRRRGSNASVGSSTGIGGSLDSQHRRDSTVREAAPNAISTLVHPPIVRTGLLPHGSTTAAASGFKAPTTRDIPPVALTNIDHIPPKTFRDYLQRVGPLLENFERSRAAPEQAQWLKKDKELDRTDRFAAALDRRMSQSSISSPTTPLAPPSATLSPLASPATEKRRPSAYRRNRNEPTPLSTVPTVYFDEDFHLENPRTFDIVSERAEVVRPPPGTPQHESKAANGTALPPRKALATNAILQEKLSWYMDTVEVHLINSISTASTGFFAALGSLKELQTEAEESVAKIQSLREDLRRLDQEIAVGGLEVAAKRRKRANLDKLGRATEQVRQVVENVKKADALVDDGAFNEAADQMDKVGRLVCGRPEAGDDGGQLIDLRPLKALQGLDSGLQELQLRIGSGFANQFTSTLIADLRQHMEKVSSTDTLKRWSRQRGITPVYLESNDEFRRHLLGALKGLQRAGHMAPATTAYREAVNKEMKSIIRKHLPSSNDDDTDSMVSISTRGGGKLSQQEKSSILARHLRALDAEDAEKLLISVYTGVGEALRRLSTQTKILLDVTSSMQALEPKSPSRSPVRSPSATPGRGSIDDQLANGARKSFENDDISQALDMSSLLEQAVDTAQTQITRILKVRNEQSIRLPKERFLRYFTLNRLFADECEAVSGRGGQALKGLINAQISGFVQVMGTAETERIANLLDNDDWNSKDFTDQDNVLLQRILKSMSSDPPEWLAGKPIWEEPSSAAELAADLPNGEANGASTPNAPATAKAVAKPAYIDDTRYILVHSVIALLPTVERFLSLTASIASMTPQISNSLLDVLRTFNSRSCQLILGAGATRSAGLKNITTKHLALASQALSFIIALVPYMRECARRHLPSGQTAVLAEFDKTKRLCQDHQVGIHDKLVEIMTMRSQAHVKAMKAIDFDNAAASDKPSAYMETLTKETLTLQRVLARHLSEFDVRMIMRQISTSYKEQWIKAFGEVQASGEAGMHGLLRDAEAFEAKLGKVEGFDDIGRGVLEVVKAKKSAKASGDGEKGKAAEKGKPVEQKGKPMEEKEKPAEKKEGETEEKAG